MSPYIKIWSELQTTLTKKDLVLFKRTLQTMFKKETKVGRCIYFYHFTFTTLGTQNLQENNVK